MTKKWLTAVAAAGMLGATVAAHAAFPGFTDVYFNDFQAANTAGWSASASNIFPSALPVSDVPPTASPAYQGQRFLGEFGGQDSLTLTVTNPFGGPVTVFLGFDAYFIRSWDGNDSEVVNGMPLGPDTLKVSVAGVGAALLDATFSIGTRNGQDQSYCPFGTAPCQPTFAAKGVNQLGYFYEIDPKIPDGNGGFLPFVPFQQDMVYAFGSRPESPGFLFQFTGPVLTFSFSSANLQVRNDLPNKLADESWGLDNVRVEVMAHAVPEPGTYALLGAGLLAVLAITRRRARRRA